MSGISADEYQATLSLLWGWATMIRRMPLAEMYRLAERSDSIGAILDPTLYREKSPALQEDKQLISAFAGVADALATMEAKRK